MLVQVVRIKKHDSEVYPKFLFGFFFQDGDPTGGDPVGYSHLGPLNHLLGVGRGEQGRQKGKRRGRGGDMGERESHPPSVSSSLITSCNSASVQVISRRFPGLVGWRAEEEGREGKGREGEGRGREGG